ncbi:zinc ribbon-containing protein [Roseomonas elaeocarpi]|uniref:Protein L n=1 Tax=Roseomonas elaeocarpi TaxID=907779 RepID=A0ABV6JMA5_9PROT
MSQMALYQNVGYVTQADEKAFTVTYQAGRTAPYAGIYRCQSCGHEIASAEGQVLSPEPHPHHPQGKPIAWQLLVFAKPNRG